GGGAWGVAACRRPPPARRLAALCGGPITATSANRAGCRPAATAAEVVAGLGAGVPLVVDGPAALTGPPSTIVDVRGRDARLVREGSVAWERVLQSLA
ncbi:MAG: Sua5/YciO/YrdC/YwlC family protein, partial [Acidobacteria bacterium]|nr:Sua5/YciO/YrdC/YwlC family protein [Acidobacteriota bacterium]